MRHYEVLLTEQANEDLANIYFGLLERIPLEKAEALLDELLRTVETLATFPDRGSHPQELTWLGVREFRQIHCRQYRLIYRRNDEKTVVICLIADGRQDVQSLLERRLLDA